MSDEIESKPDGEPQSQESAAAPPRSAPRRRDDSEKAIGLEMARLFGMDPKLMMAPKVLPQEPPEPVDDDDPGQPDA